MRDDPHPIDEEHELARAERPHGEED